MEIFQLMVFVIPVFRAVPGFFYCTLFMKTRQEPRLEPEQKREKNLEINIW